MALNDFQFRIIRILAGSHIYFQMSITYQKWNSYLTIASHFSLSSLP